MSQKKLISLGAFLLILFAPGFIHAKSNYKYVHKPETDIYFGHISYTEIKHDGKDPIVIRVGGNQVEVALLNLPITVGDIIRTSESRRCEIQFDTGTIIRLDYATELKIETILAQSLSSRKKLTNFVLTRGEIYVMYKRYKTSEIFQVIAPNSAVKLKHKAVALINAIEDGRTAVQVNYGKADVIYGSNKKNVKDIRLKKSEKLTISRNHRALLGEYVKDVDFELWNMSLNENFEELHEGMNILPKPIQRFPKSVLYFAQKYSNMHGEWLWDSLYGYVWRPYLNDRRYPSGNWQPYYAGRWSNVNGQLFWVPEETWGWVPYHLGFWKWNTKRGWLWIPGSVFAPAWVSWSFFGSNQGYYSWRPWSMWDWYMGSGYRFYDNPYRYYLLGDYLGLEEGFPGQVGSTGKPVRTVIRKADLRQRKLSPSKLPREFRPIYKRFLASLNRLDKRILDDLPRMREHMIIVKKDDLNASSIRDKSIDFRKLTAGNEKEFLSQRSTKNYYRMAAEAFRENRDKGKLSDQTIRKILNRSNQIKTLPYEPVSGVKKKAVSFGRTWEQQKMVLRKSGIIIEGIKRRERTERNRSLIPVYPRSTSLRFRDWNPDVKIASRAGVTIRYSSRTNEVRIPELNISSRSLRGRLNRGSIASIISSGRSSYSGSYSSSGSSSSSSSRSSSSSSSSGGSSSSKTKKK